MKRHLFVLFWCTLFILPIEAQKSVQLYPRASFVGVTQKGTTYTKQSIEKDPKHFFVGYNSSTQTYGRGYLEFDLSKIPTNAKVTSAALRLSGNAIYYSNLGGKIRLERAGLGFAYAGEGEWNLLKPIGYGNDGIGIQATFTDNPSDIQYISGNYLTNHLDDNKGKKIAFLIAHLESNKLIYLSGTNETLYLDITYIESPSGGGNNGGGVVIPIPPVSNGNTGNVVNNGDSYPLPSRILSGDTLTLGYKNLDWKFTKVEYNGSQLFEISRSKGAIKFLVRNIIGSERASVVIGLEQKMIFFPTSTRNVTYSFPINGTPIIKSNIYPTIACSGETIVYRIENFLGNQSDITWQSGTNMTLISTSGIYATFKASGSGYGTVKATVNDNGKIYNLQSSEVWVGVPPQVTLSGAVADGGELRAGGTYSWGYHRLNNYSFTPISYSWNGVEYTNKPVITFTVPTNATYFSIGLRIKNVCGWSYETWARYRVTANGTPGGGGPPELRTLSVTNQPEIKSIKIYNLSGILVYSNNAVDSNFDIKSTVLTDGVYIIEKFDGENKTSEKVMLKR